MPVSDDALLSPHMALTRAHMALNALTRSNDRFAFHELTCINTICTITFTKHETSRRLAAACDRNVLWVVPHFRNTRVDEQIIIYYILYIHIIYILNIIYLNIYIYMSKVLT